MSQHEPEVITICGSTRFAKEMRDLERHLTWAGNLVFAPTKFDLKTPDPLWADPEELKAGIERLKEVHYTAIRASDWVLVYGDYAGESVRSEIAYANELEVPIRFTDPDRATEFGGMIIRPYL